MSNEGQYLLEGNENGTSNNYLMSAITSPQLININQIIFLHYGLDHFNVKKYSIVANMPFW
jgi:hypothetical protein